MAGKIKGTILQSRKNFVFERFGAEALERILAILPQSDQDILRGIIVPLTWYPSETNFRFDDSIIKTIGGPSRAAFWELGRQSAEYNLGKFQSNFVKGKNPVSFLAQTPTIYRLYYEVGKRDFEPSGESSGVITTTGAEGVTVGDCLTVMGWYERALEMVGAKMVRITHPVCRASGGPECRYEITWS